MNATGLFNDDMKNFFQAEEGAYTTFTDVEIKKKTFNVKSVIRNMLIDRMGRANIPVVNVSPNQTICFNVCKKAKIYGKTTIDIPCKFSKKNKDEMSIYFNQKMIEEFHVQAGDSWYIYFERESISPIIGIMSKEKWENIFSDEEDICTQEPDESNGHELNYTDKVEDMVLIEETAPKQGNLSASNSLSIVKSVSPEEAAGREKNKKNKGNRGELIAIEIEKRRLTALGRTDLLDRITHVAKYKDGLGYDIISTDIDSEGNEVEIYIEVKATAGDINMPFYVSKREVEVSQKLRSAYYLYRIYEMKEKKKTAKFYRLNGEISDNFDLKPTNYLATKK